MVDIRFQTTQPTRVPKTASYKFAAGKLTHYSSTPQRPSDYSLPRLRRILSGDVHPGPAIAVLGGYIRSLLVFKTQRNTDELRTGHVALAVHHSLYRYHNRFHHQLQYKLSIGIPSPCNSTQMSSATY